jgi:hypothetical protein
MRTFLITIVALAWAFVALLVWSLIDMSRTMDDEMNRHRGGE